MNDEFKPSGLTPATYITGFVLSIFFTITAYLFVAHQLLGRRMLIAIVAILALAQFFTQLVFFLHISAKTNTRWKLLVFCFMTLVVAILVFGSLWIMYSLNYHMSLQQMENYMNSQGDGL